VGDFFLLCGGLSLLGPVAVYGISATFVRLLSEFLENVGIQLRDCPKKYDKTINENTLVVKNTGTPLCPKTKLD